MPDHMLELEVLGGLAPDAEVPIYVRAPGSDDVLVTVTVAADENGLAVHLDRMHPEAEHQCPTRVTVGW